MSIIELIERRANRAHAEAHGLTLIEDLSPAEQKAIHDDMEQKARYVRTAAGVRRFKRPIGAIILPRGMGSLDRIRIKDPVFKGFDLVEDRKGNLYDVGKDDSTGKFVALRHNSWDDQVEPQDSLDKVLEALNDKLGGGTNSDREEGEEPKPKAKKPAPKKAPSKAPEPKDEASKESPAAAKAREDALSVRNAMTATNGRIDGHEKDQSALLEKGTTKAERDAMRRHGELITEIEDQTRAAKTLKRNRATPQDVKDMMDLVIESEKGRKDRTIKARDAAKKATSKPKAPEPKKTPEPAKVPDAPAKKGRKVPAEGMGNNIGGGTVGQEYPLATMENVREAGDKKSFLDLHHATFGARKATKDELAALPDDEFIAAVNDIERNGTGPAAAVRKHKGTGKGQTAPKKGGWADGLTPAQVDAVTNLNPKHTATYMGARDRGLSHYQAFDEISGPGTATAPKGGTMGGQGSKERDAFIESHPKLKGVNDYHKPKLRDLSEKNFRDYLAAVEGGKSPDSIGAIMSRVDPGASWNPTTEKWVGQNSKGRPTSPTPTGDTSASDAADAAARKRVQKMKDEERSKGRTNPFTSSLTESQKASVDNLTPGQYAKYMNRRDAGDGHHKALAESNGQADTDRARLDKIRKTRVTGTPDEKVKKFDDLMKALDHFDKTSESGLGPESRKVRSNLAERRANALKAQGDTAREKARQENEARERQLAEDRETMKMHETANYARRPFTRAENDFTGTANMIDNGKLKTKRQAENAIKNLEKNIAKREAMMADKTRLDELLARDVEARQRHLRNDKARLKKVRDKVSAMPADKEPAPYIPPSQRPDPDAPGGPVVMTTRDTTPGRAAQDREEREASAREKKIREGLTKDFAKAQDAARALTQGPDMDSNLRRYTAARDRLDNAIRQYEVGRPAGSGVNGQNERHYRDSQALRDILDNRIKNFREIRSQEQADLKREQEAERQRAQAEQSTNRIAEDAARSQKNREARETAEAAQKYGNTAMLINSNQALLKKIVGLGRSGKNPYPHLSEVRERLAEIDNRLSWTNDELGGYHLGKGKAESDERAAQLRADLTDQKNKYEKAVALIESQSGGSSDARTSIADGEVSRYTAAVNTGLTNMNRDLFPVEGRRQPTQRDVDFHRGQIQAAQKRLREMEANEMSDRATRWHVQASMDVSAGLRAIDRAERNLSASNGSAGQSPEARAREAAPSTPEPFSRRLDIGNNVIMERDGQREPGRVTGLGPGYARVTFADGTTKDYDPTNGVPLDGQGPNIRKRTSEESGPLNAQERAQEEAVNALVRQRGEALREAMEAMDAVDFSDSSPEGEARLQAAWDKIKEAERESNERIREMDSLKLTNTQRSRLSNSDLSTSGRNSTAGLLLQRLNGIQNRRAPIVKAERERRLKEAEAAGDTLTAIAITKELEAAEMSNALGQSARRQEIKRNWDRRRDQIRKAAEQRTAQPEPSGATGSAQPTRLPSVDSTLTLARTQIGKARRVRTERSAQDAINTLNNTEHSLQRDLTRSGDRMTSEQRDEVQRTLQAISEARRKAEEKTPVSRRTTLRPSDIPALNEQNNQNRDYREVARNRATSEAMGVFDSLPTTVPEGQRYGSPVLDTDALDAMASSDAPSVPALNRAIRDLEAQEDTTVDEEIQVLKEARDRLKERADRERAEFDAANTSLFGDDFNIPERPVVAPVSMRRAEAPSSAPEGRVLNMRAINEDTAKVSTARRAHRRAATAQERAQALQGAPATLASLDNHVNTLYEAVNSPRLTNAQRERVRSQITSVETARRDLRDMIDGFEMERSRSQASGTRVVSADDDMSKAQEHLETIRATQDYRTALSEMRRLRALERRLQKFTEGNDMGVSHVQIAEAQSILSRIATIRAESNSRFAADIARAQSARA